MQIRHLAGGFHDLKRFVFAFVQVNHEHQQFFGFWKGLRVLDGVGEYQSDRRAAA